MLSNHNIFKNPIYLECYKDVDNILNNINFDSNLDYEMTPFKWKQFCNLVKCLKIDMPALAKNSVDDEYAEKLFKLICDTDKKYSPKRFLAEIISIINNEYRALKKIKKSIFEYLPNVSRWVQFNQ